jgi:tight adherence protein B
VIPWLDQALRQLRSASGSRCCSTRRASNLRAGTLILLACTFAVGGYIIGHRDVPPRVPGARRPRGCSAAAAALRDAEEAQRMRAFAREFPDALDLLVSALRAGLSFTAAMQIVADESPSRCAASSRHGRGAVARLDPREALLNLTERVDVLDLRLLRDRAVLLQRETGGNLAKCWRTPRR